MHDYITSQTYYFKEAGQKVQAGQTVTLSRGAAERYMQSHPGLLRPAIVTTMRDVGVVRGVETPAVEVVAEVVAEVEAPTVETPVETVVEPVIETPAVETPAVEKSVRKPRAKK